MGKRGGYSRWEARQTWLAGGPAPGRLLQTEGIACAEVLGAGPARGEGWVCAVGVQGGPCSPSSRKPLEALSGESGGREACEASWVVRLASDRWWADGFRVCLEVELLRDVGVRGGIKGGSWLFKGLGTPEGGGWCRSGGPAKCRSQNWGPFF